MIKKDTQSWLVVIYFLITSVTLYDYMEDGGWFNGWFGKLLSIAYIAVSYLVFFWIAYHADKDIEEYKTDMIKKIEKR